MTAHFSGSKPVRTIILPAIIIVFLLVAGCTTGNPSGNPVQKTGTSVVPGPTTASLPVSAVPSNTTVTLGTIANPFTVSLDSFRVSTPADNATVISIYVTVKNTGRQPVRLAWFSKLTGINGMSYGGIGSSNGGRGAKTASILPSAAETSRDSVVIDSRQGLAALSEGSTLDVYFMEQTGNGSVPFSPDYHVSWALHKVRFG